MGSPRGIVGSRRRLGELSLRKDWDTRVSETREKNEKDVHGRDEQPHEQRAIGVANVGHRCVDVGRRDVDDAARRERGREKRADAGEKKAALAPDGARSERRPQRPDAARKAGSLPRRGGQRRASGAAAALPFSGVRAEQR